MKGLKSFFSLAVAAVFCFFVLAVVPGCWDGDGGSGSTSSSETKTAVVSTLPEIEHGQATGGFHVFVDFNKGVRGRGINNDMEYQLFSFLRKKVDIVYFEIKFATKQKYGHKSFVVVGGICDAEIVLPVGEYLLYVEAGAAGIGSLVQKDVPLHIATDIISELSLKLELGEKIKIPVKITRPTGEYTQGGYYNIDVIPQEVFHCDGGGGYYDGELRFELFISRPFQVEIIKLTIFDRSKGLYIPLQTYEFPFNVLNVLTLNGERMELAPEVPPEPETGGVKPVLSFEDEEVFKLSKSSELQDGTLEDPTGYAGDPNCLVGSFILQVDNDEVVKGGNFEIFCDAKYFNEATFNMTKMGGEYDAIWSYTIGGDIIPASMPFYIELEPGYYQLKAHADVKTGVETPPEAFTIGVVCHAQGMATGIYYSTKIVESQKIFIAPVVQ